MARLTRICRAGLAAAAGLALMLGLAGCSDYTGALPKHMRPLDSSTRALVERKGMELRSPILIRIFKEEARLEVWKQEKSSSRYAFLKDYEICAWSGVLGPKKKEGDRQAPEGFYTIRPAQMNPNSNYYLAFNMGYPNEFDRSLGRTGSELMVHGACSSRGCYSMTDEHIQEIYTLGRLAFQGGQRDFQVHAFPFRMTPQNLARHRNDPNMPFWLMLKEGYDHFEVLRQPPSVNVCENRYIFNSAPEDGRSFNPSAQCPPMAMPDGIRVAVAEKAARDNARLVQIAERLDQRERTDGASKITLALAQPSSAARAAPMSISTASLPLEPAATASVARTTLPIRGQAISPSQERALARSTDPLGRATAAPARRATASASASRPAWLEPSQPVQQEQAETATVAPVPSPRPAATPSVVATTSPAPQRDLSNDPSFLPIPQLRTEEVSAPEPQPRPAAAPPEPENKLLAGDGAATLAERMLVESAPADPSVANAYAEAEEQDGGLTGFVLRLMKDE